MTQQLTLCAQEVKTQDHDQFLCGLFSPDGLADDYYAMHVFYMETARIRDKVQEPQIGLIRLQWWADLVERCYSGEQGKIDTSLHQDIARVLKLKIVDKTLLDRYLNARQFDMQDQAHDDLDALLRYAEATGGTMAQIKSQVIGHDIHTAQLKIGTAVTLLSIIRTLAFQARQIKCKLPKDLVNKHGLNMKEFSELTCTPSLKACVKEVMDVIEKLIDEARSETIRTSPVMLATVALEDSIKRLKKVDYDPFNPNIGNGRLIKQLRLGYLAFRGKY